MNDPFTVERHPASYPWRKRFPDAGMLLGLEGGVVYAAEAEGALWIITDEGTMSEFLSKEDHDLLAILVTLERYTSATAWAQWTIQPASPSRPPWT